MGKINTKSEQKHESFKSLGTTKYTNTKSGYSNTNI